MSSRTDSNRIPRFTRNCGTSRRSRVSSSLSVGPRPAITPSRRSALSSASATHARMEWAVGSSSRARSSGPRLARTRITIWRRNSGIGNPGSWHRDKFRRYVREIQQFGSISVGRCWSLLDNTNRDISSTNLTLVADAFSRKCHRALARQLGPEGLARVVQGAAVARIQPVILLVDDDDDVRETSADMLTELGYQVQQADCGQKALDLLETSGFDVMVTDIRMPGMSGIELSSVALTRHHDLKIILVSGYFQPQTLHHRFLQKPFRTADLDIAIRAELSNRPI